MKSGHYVAIFGGSVAGSEAASELAKRGIRVVVFDQFDLPYGKLESGLPKWHHNLRDRQEKIIDEKLDHELIEFVPGVKLGRDVNFPDVADTWGFSAVLLATGAWRDRPLPAPGFDDYIGKGFLYQNPFVNWFNHNHEPDYKGPVFEVPDKTSIIGGGLASLDVAKIAMIEIVRKALLKLGIEKNVLALERKGIAKILDESGLKFEDLGIEGCTLFTRQGVNEMPLTPIPDNADNEIIEKAYNSRQNILNRVLEKYLFKIELNKIASKPVVTDGILSGVVFQETETIGEKINLIENAFTSVETRFLISAIGSVPEVIPGLPLKGEIYDVEDMESGKIRGFSNVFVLGNAVTGRGNIRQSQMHGRQVSENIVDQYLVWQEEDYEEIFDAAANRVDARVESIGKRLNETKPLTSSEIEQIREKVKLMQVKSGYDGNYVQWISDHIPVRLEQLLEQ